MVCSRVVLALIGFVILIPAISNNLTGSVLIAFLLRVLQIAFIVATVKGCSDKKIYGPICGIIVSILLILARDIIDIIFGVLYLIDCIKLVNYMRK